LGIFHGNVILGGNGLYRESFGPSVEEFIAKIPSPILIHVLFYQEWDIRFLALYELFIFVNFMAKNCIGILSKIEYFRLKIEYLRFASLRAVGSPSRKPADQL
jgi:hypothetical protein